MPKNIRAPLVRSTRRAEYADMSDADVTLAYLRMRDTRRTMYAEMDNSAPLHPDHADAWDMCDSQAHALDDELCARDMELPT